MSHHQIHKTDTHAVATEAARLSCIASSARVPHKTRLQTCRNLGPPTPPLAVACKTCKTARRLLNRFQNTSPALCLFRSTSHNLNVSGVVAQTPVARPGRSAWTSIPSSAIAMTTILSSSRCCNSIWFKWIRRHTPSTESSNCGRQISAADCIPVTVSVLSNVISERTLCLTPALCTHGMSCSLAITSNKA